MMVKPKPWFLLGYQRKEIMRLTLVLLLLCVCVVNAALKRQVKEAPTIGVQSESGKGKRNIGKSMKKTAKITEREQIVEKAVRPGAKAKTVPSQKNENESKTSKVSYYCIQRQIDLS